MNAKRFAPLTLLLTLICGDIAIGISVPEPLSVHMTRTEMIVIGTMTDREYAHNPATNGFITHLTFNVHKTIEGEPNIDADTLIFCIPGGEGVNPKDGKRYIHHNTMGQAYAHFEIGDTLILFMHYNEHIARWMPQRNGLYPVQAWTVEKKKVDGREEYTVYPYSNSIDDKLKHHFLGVPLELFIRFVEVLRQSPDTADPVTKIIGDAIMEGLEKNIERDTPEANRINANVLNRIKQAVVSFEATQPRRENLQ